MIEIHHDSEFEAEPESSYQILTTARYIEMVSQRQGVGLTEAIARGDDEGMRANYVLHTEKLIDTMRHGFKREEGIDHEQADVVFFLDKSARPLEWFTEAFWEVFKEADGSVPEKPERKFINLHAQESPGGARPDAAVVSQFVRDGQFDEEVSEMQAIYPDMAGKNILVVDEVSVSGATERMAYELFRRAFPEAHIKSAAWKGAGKKLDKAGNSFPVEIPVWYSKVSEEGRGIRPLDAERSRQSASLAQREGGLILSTGLEAEKPDLDAQRLRREFQQLARDVVSGKQPIIPADPDSDRYEGLTIRHPEPPTKRSLFD